MKKFERMWLEQIDAIIENNIANADFRLIDVTNELEISRAKLYRDILKLTGFTPSRYIQKKRLEKAKRMLEEGIFPTVKETAITVGFRRPEYFTKLFYREYAVLPVKVLKRDLY